MIRKNINLNSAILFLILILSSCASILNPKYQKVAINKPAASEVLINGYAAEIKKDKFLFNRDGESKQITIHKDGFKDENLTIIQNRKSPLYIMSIVPFGILVIPAFYDNLLKSRNYTSTVNLPRELTPLPDKDKFNNQIYFSPTAFDLASDSLKTTNFIIYNKYIQGDQESTKEVTGDDFEMEKLKVLNPNLLLIQSMEQKEYSSNSSKEIEITANISSVKKQYINAYKNQSWTTYPSFGEMLVTQLGIEWTIKVKGEKRLSYYTNAKSGEFAIGSGNTSLYEAEKNAIADAAEFGFIELTNLPEFQQIIANSEFMPSVSAENLPLNDSKLGNLDGKEKVKETSKLITIEENEDNIYLVKGDKKKKINKELGRGNFNKDILLEFVQDQPELYAFADENFHKGFGFVSSLISCYNDLQLNPTQTINQTYYYQFGLITKAEWKKGPSAEILKEKKYISGEIFQVITITQKYVNGMPTTSTTGDNFKVTFSYGNAEYKSGFMMKNLKTAFQDDKEAIKYIKKYRSKKIRRYTFGAIGVAIIGVAIYIANGEEIFGLDDDATPFVAVPGVLIAGGILALDRSYKTELIGQAINTYNLNLSKSKK